MTLRPNPVSDPAIRNINHRRSRFAQAVVLGIPYDSGDLGPAGSICHGSYFAAEGIFITKEFARKRFIDDSERRGAGVAIARFKIAATHKLNAQRLKIAGRDKQFSGNWIGGERFYCRSAETRKPWVAAKKAG
jgi:hypothetical protein